MKLRCAATGELPGHWTDGHKLSSAMQTDGSSCGAFVLLVSSRSNEYYFVEKQSITVSVCNVFVDSV